MSAGWDKLRWRKISLLEVYYRVCAVEVQVFVKLHAVLRIYLTRVRVRPEITQLWFHFASLYVLNEVRRVMGF